jgi:hypothetical protein
MTRPPVMAILAKKARVWRLECGNNTDRKKTKKSGNSLAIGKPVS